MLITDRNSPMIAKNDIKCFKVMVALNGVFYVCPPAYQYFLQNNKLIEYRLNTLYSEKSNDSKKDYRKDGTIGEWFFHTFCDIESALDFINYLNKKLNNPESTKHPELYRIPDGAKLVILNALIPKWSLYYEWTYKEINSEKTYASNKIIYGDIYVKQKRGHENIPLNLRI